MLNKYHIHKYLPLLISILAIICRMLPGPRTIDDAFITFRYARNILAGDGFVYNPGEHVLGTTTPLYTFLMVIIGLFLDGSQAPFPHIALVVNALADSISCILLYEIGKKLYSWKAGLGAALIWSIAPYSVTFAIGGLETSVYILLLISLAWGWINQRRIFSALLAAAALLIRPDSLILLGPLFVDRLWQYYQQHKRFSSESTHSDYCRSSIKPTWIFEILALIIPTATWITFATLYFGNPLPHSIMAKAVAYRLPENTALIRLIQHYATPFMEQNVFGISFLGIGMILYPFLALLGTRIVLKKDKHTWPIFLFPWFYIVAFAVANPLIFRWYLSPPLPIYILSILIGMDQLLKYILTNKWFEKIYISLPHLLYNSASLIFIILLPLFLLSKEWTLHPDHGLNRPAPRMAWYQLELLYQKAAQALISDEINTSSIPILAAGDVGVLGYFTNWRILDTVGLNSPQSLKYYPLDRSYYAINYAIPPQLILDLKPDFIIILEIYGRKGLLIHPVFLKEYQLQQKFSTDIYGSDGLLIYKRLIE